MILVLRGVVVQVFLNACLPTPSLHLSLRARSVLTKPTLFSLRRGGGLALFLACCVGGTWMQRGAQWHCGFWQHNLPLNPLLGTSSPAQLFVVL